ncbi:aldo/keto reductase [Streptomyces sp. NPDC093111]|uniref:aldo/keto reductase n=1 Tax=Streptomyces sp. NPDC093111 TaxID=3154978 RepID=UPI003432AADE
MTSDRTTTTATAPTPSPTPSVDAAASGTWTLGDLPVRRIGFGTMRLPQTGAALVEDTVPRDRAQAIAVLRKAVDLGVNHMDTAAFYFSRLRSANELLNRALAGPSGRYPDDLVIATKVGPARDASGAWTEPARTPAALRAQVEENLRQLGRDHLDVVNLRVLGTDSVAERFGALADLREAGLIRHLGVSNVTPEQLEEARGIAPVVCVQNMYGIGVRPEYAEFVRHCGEQGIAFVPFYSIAAAGREGGTTAAPEPAEILAVAREHDATPAQIRLAWTLHQGPHLLAIPGTGDLGHLTANVAAGALRLTDEDLTRLAKAHAPTGP